MMYIGVARRFTVAVPFRCRRTLLMFASLQLFHGNIQISVPDRTKWYGSKSVTLLNVGL
jgi:hypothetical protein